MRLATIVAAVVTGALLLTACGSSKKSSSTSTAAPAATTPASTTPTTTPAKTQELELYDYRFDPKGVPVNPPGAKIKLKLKNEGKVEHTFTIDSLHIDKELQPGKTATVSFTGPKSGIINFYCKYHKAKGMIGALLAGGVKSSKPPTGAPSTDTSGGSGSGY